MMLLSESHRRDGIMRKGEWRAATTPVTQVHSALICCPKCGKLSCLSAHTIDPDGTVTPRLACPFKCGFLDYVKLADWKA